MLFLRLRYCRERVAGRGRRRVEKDPTAARCWQITWCRPRPRWTVQEEPAQDPGTVALGLALRWTPVRPWRRLTPVGRARTQEQLSPRNQAPKSECPPAGAPGLSRCHPVAATNQGWAARVEAPASPAEMALAAASVEMARGRPTPVPGTAPMQRPAGESLLRMGPVGRAVARREIRQFEELKSAAAVALLRCRDLVQSLAPTIRAPFAVAPAKSHKRSMW